RAARQQALPHDPGPRPCGRRALRHPRRRAGPLQGKGRLPLVAEADHVGLITRIWYQAETPLIAPVQIPRASSIRAIDSALDLTGASAMALWMGSVVHAHA